MAAAARGEHRGRGSRAESPTQSGRSTNRASTVEPSITAAAWICSSSLRSTRITIAPDKAAIAEQAVERIHHRIAGETPDGPREIVTLFRLEVRESTAGRP